jgi:hypothetical protein
MPTTGPSSLAFHVTRLLTVPIPSRESAVPHNRKTSSVRIIKHHSPTSSFVLLFVFQIQFPPKTLGNPPCFLICSSRINAQSTIHPPQLEVLRSPHSFLLRSAEQICIFILRVRLPVPPSSAGICTSIWGGARGLAPSYGGGASFYSFSKNESPPYMCIFSKTFSKTPHLWGQRHSFRSGFFNENEYPVMLDSTFTTA